MNPPLQMQKMNPNRSVRTQMAKSDIPPGYPQIANIMDRYPEIAMVRRFRGLNARHLLYLQAELSLIEKKLLAQEKADADSGDPTKLKYAQDYFFLKRSAANEEDNAQWELLQEMREKLKEYNEVLIQQTTLAQVLSPTKHDADIMKDWYLREDYGNDQLMGADRFVWAEQDRDEFGPNVSEYREDLIALNSSTAIEDETTQWLAQKFIPNWHEKFWSRSHPGIQGYSERVLSMITSILATILSSLLPVLSIVVLYLVHSMPARLGVIAAFTAGFSIVLAVITSASRIDNFAATAAFAAVQVVFVGTNSNNTAGG